MISGVETRGPGWFYGHLFKVPVLFYRAGLDFLVPGWILVLTTVGRKSGRLRETAVGYLVKRDMDEFWLLAGWGEKTDWYQNACKNPKVTFRLGRQKREGTARILTYEERVVYLEEILKVNPGAVSIFSRRAGQPVSSDRESLEQAAHFFPGLALRELRIDDK